MRVHVSLNQCACLHVCFYVCVCVVCIAVPIVRWRSVRCAAVRRPLSSSLLALWLASRQPPEMQDSVLGKEILVLSPCPSLCPSSTTHPLPRPTTTKCSQNAMQERADFLNSFNNFSVAESILSFLAWSSPHTNPKLQARPESRCLF